MADIRAILLVPTEAHREALIGPASADFLEATPPVAWLRRRPDVGESRWSPAPGYVSRWGFPLPPVPTALVLAWDGRPVADGICRFQRWFDRVYGAVPERQPSDEVTLRWLRAGHKSRDLAGCRVVLLDADGREVTGG